MGDWTYGIHDANVLPWELEQAIEEIEVDGGASLIVRTDERVALNAM